MAYALAIHPTTGEVYVAGRPTPTTFLKLLAGRRQVATVYQRLTPVGRFCGKAELRPYPNPPIHLSGRKR
jgi:hypothetical protein